MYVYQDYETDALIKLYWIKTCIAGICGYFDFKVYLSLYMLTTNYYSNMENNIKRPSEWIMEMGTDVHCCANVDQLTNYSTYAKNGQLYVKGFIRWLTPDKMRVKIPITDVKIENKQYRNVISLSTIMKKGMKVKFENNSCLVERDGKVILEGRRIDGEYKINTYENHEDRSTTTTNDLFLPLTKYEKTTSDTQESNQPDQCNIEGKEPEHLDPEVYKKEDKKDEPMLAQYLETDNLDYITCEPQDLEEVSMLSPEEQLLWKGAMKEEMDSMARNEVLEEMKPDVGDKVIGSRWTFSTKLSEHGRVSKIKARLVAMGCHQREGTDFQETYAPVVSHTTIRLLLTLVASRNLYIRHCDVTSAFLYGKLEERIFMREPRGPHAEGKIYLLRRAIYGLKQAAFCWHTRIESSLQKLGYRNNKIDHCLFRQEQGNNNFILIHVDDLLLVGGTEDEIARCIQELRKEYLIKDLGEARKYLGMNIEYYRKRREIFIHQIPMIKLLLKEYGMENCHPSFTPMVSDYSRGLANDDSPELPNNKQYQKAIGSLLYIGLISRPDIHLAVNILSRYTTKPNQSHWEAIKRIIRYLNTTTEYRLRLGGIKDLQLTTYCDADWAGDVETRKSTSGQVIFLSDGLVEWKASQQSSISLSTAEAEFIAAAEAVQTLSWLKELCKELNIPENLPLLVYTDNQSCLKMYESKKN